MSKSNESQNDRIRQHINEMKERLCQLYGKDGFVFESISLSPRQEEMFLENILSMEEAEEHVLFDTLEKSGVQLPQPVALDDTRLHTVLWAVINGMAQLGCYLSNTDHLSDRQLYELLWNELLREPTSVYPDKPKAAVHFDILGGCSEEDLQTRLKYYAGEQDRLDWAAEYPDDTIPPHEPLPYDRDRYLPAPENFDSNSGKAL